MTVLEIALAGKVVVMALAIEIVVVAALAVLLLSTRRAVDRGDGTTFSKRFTK